MISLKDKKRLYQLLQKHLSYGLQPMNSIAQLLTDHGISSQTFGYNKLKSLLQDIPEFIEFVHTGNGEQVPLLYFNQWNRPTSGIAKKSRKRLKSSKDKVTPTDSVRRDSLVSLSPPRLLPVARLENKTMEVLKSKLAKAESALPSLLEAAYQQARATDRLSVSDDTLRFEMDFTGFLEQPMILTFKKMRPDAHGRYLSFQYVDVSGLPSQLMGSSAAQNPARALEQFAFLGHWEEFLHQLAELALPEEWDFCGYPSPRYYILKKYLQYTFYRLQYENKVAISHDRRLAAFNTGLVDQHFDDIYACFTPNNAGSSPWLFKEFAIAGHRGMGKQLVHKFNPLPKPAHYVTRKEDLLFDLEKELHCDYDHIIIENIDRFNLEFLKSQFYDNQSAYALVQDLQKTADPAVREHIYERLEDLLEDNPVLYARLKNRLDDATSLARKQVRWNYKAAIPSYYPSRNSMNLMLPLNLTQSSAVDNVLVVELTPSGNYQGQTILTLEQAYIDARLICSPQSNWLNTSSIVECHIDDD